jgi:hypothetical protein
MVMARTLFMVIGVAMSFTVIGVAFVGLLILLVFLCRPIIDARRKRRIGATTVCRHPARTSTPVSIGR